jgi:hypothetical protein
VARMAKALMPRLRRAGFPTMLEFPESINAHVACDYIDALKDDPQFWQWVGLISYHWYGRDNPTYMAELSDFARARGLPTAQTEFMGLTIDHLYDDLTIGNTSYWELYGLAGPDYRAALTHVSSRTFRGGDWYWRFRQVSHYVRPGAVRIGCASSEPALRCLAFVQGGATTIVLINTTAPRVARTVTVAGLTPGIYGVSGCVGRKPYEEVGASTVGAEGTLSVAVPADSVMTVYSHGAANLPPTMTQWVSDPDFLEAPASSVRLTCAATDPERETLSYGWSLVSQPQGAHVALAQTGEPSIRADGLDVPGQYVFEARVSDGTHAVARQVLVDVFAGNQPPVVNDVHNRIPVWVRVKDGGTLLRSGAWDIEDDPLRYSWSVLSQPAGAAAALQTPEEAACRVTGMIRPGDYVFRLQVSDPTHTVTVEHTVPVYR